MLTGYHSLGSVLCWHRLEPTHELTTSNRVGNLQLQQQQQQQ
jgi:hypothetical protein